MSFLGGIVDSIGSGIKAAVNVGEDVLGGAVKVGEGVLHAGIDTVGDLVKNPLELLNPFAVLSDAGHNLVKDVVGEFAPAHGSGFAQQATDAASKFVAAAGRPAQGALGALT